MRNHTDAGVSPLVDRALALAARWHAGQTRKGKDIPYIQHPVAVGMLLDRLGYDDEVIAAGLLHDVVEDAGVPIDEIARQCGPRVGALVAHCTEQKLDASGTKRPWLERKADHLRLIAHAPPEARAILLADKWHNLFSTNADLDAGEPVWSRFNAPRDVWLEMTRRFVQALAKADDSDERLARLSRLCENELSRLT